MSESVTITWKDAREGIKRIIAMTQAALASAPVVISVKRLSKTDLQRRHYHALLGEISRKIKVDFIRDAYGEITHRNLSLLGKHSYELGQWKALLIHLYERELASFGIRLRKPSKKFLALEGDEMVTYRASSEDFSRKEAQDFIEFLYAYGSGYGMTWETSRLDFDLKNIQEEHAKHQRTE